MLTFQTHPNVREPMHAVLAQFLRDSGCPQVVVGGTADHVHILFDLGKQNRPVDLVRQVKITSSKFAKTLGPDFRQFRWQTGYGLFSVSPPQWNAVERYVRNQEEHHKKVDFQDEYRKFLRRYQIDYDERYVWD